MIFIFISSSQLFTNINKIKELLLKGFIGLEKEALRITPDGMMAHSPDPFKNEKHIVYDFCENQVEINTPAVDSASEAVRLLEEYTGYVQKKLYEITATGSLHLQADQVQGFKLGREMVRAYIPKHIQKDNGSLAYSSP